MLSELFTKAFNLIDSFIYFSLELKELLNNQKYLAPGEYVKSVIDDSCIIIIGSSKGNIIIYKDDNEIYIDNLKDCSDLKSPALDRLIYTKLYGIINNKKQ